VLRLRSAEALDIALALATSGRESDYLAWSERVVDRASNGLPLADDLDPRWASTLAQILARSMLDPSAETIALAIYRRLAGRLGPESLQPRDAQVYGQLLLQSGEHEELRASLSLLPLEP
jgi:hypothetical protein